jgi:hypothetical protein
VQVGAGWIEGTGGWHFHSFVIFMVC